jgi:hypothetical protein
MMRWEGVPPISLFKDNTAAFIHELGPDELGNANGEGMTWDSGGDARELGSSLGIERDEAGGGRHRGSTSRWLIRLSRIVNL